MAQIVRKDIRKPMIPCTFRDLDGNVPLPLPTSVLEEWYARVRDIKIAELDVENLARACRQNLYIEAVVPFCLMKLEEHPLAGEMYDGELVLALKKMSNDYWGTHSVERTQFLALAKHAYQESGDRDLDVTEDDLLRK